MSVPITPVQLGDRVRLKKPHPCGANDWEIVRVGADIGLRCQGCGRKVLLVRSEFDRRFRGFIEHAAPAETGWESGQAGPHGGHADFEGGHAGAEGSDSAG